ncbi:MAG: hypothetical protein HWD82_07090 [Flavobacteriaceae bacterium]|nr:hypothetical protein [Flavobacteriaceae bacterium]
MKSNFYTYTYSLFFLFISFGVFSQDFKLKITSKIEVENIALKNIEFNQNHKDSSSVYKEISKIHEHLKNQGYFISTIDSIRRNNSIFTTYFSLKTKVERAILFIKNKDSINIPINTLKAKLNEITNSLDKEGKSFSKVSLKNINIKNDLLFANLIVEESRSRKIKKTIVKGYEKFPKSYLKNYFKLKKRKTFSKDLIEKISENSNNLNFVNEIKAPEVLFTKDSTLLYLYFKKISNNSIDALISFASQENGGVLFNGNVDLKLSNIFNTGEQFELFWNSIGNERQEFRVKTILPYILNSPVSTNLEFSIYRQDSSFTNTKFNSIFNYDINQKLKIGLYYSSESSEELEKATNTTSFDNYFIGINVNFNEIKNDIFRNKKLFFNIASSFGKRNGEAATSNQFKIQSKANYLWEFNSRNSLYINNEIGVLNSDQYFLNELFRVGGVNSIRGFNEQSIFTKNYTFINLEYRYLTSNSSYLYTITDFGIINTTSNQSIIGLGLGYLFVNKNSKINLNIAIGKTSDNPFNFSDTKLAVSWINYF